MKPVFTVDWEAYFCYRPYSSFWEENDPLVEEPTMYLLDLLRRHNIKAIFYCLGWLVDKRPDLFELIKKEGHIIGWHTYYHNNQQVKWPNKFIDDKVIPFRAPRFKGEPRLYSGGFWFRFLPYSWSKKLLEKSGVFYIHPHDVLPWHPTEPSLRHNFKRCWGLDTVRDKLEKLCREVEFENPVL